jgi:hypothetical protein
VIVGNEADYMLVSDADYNVLRENTVRRVREARLALGRRVG